MTNFKCPLLASCSYVFLERNGEALTTHAPNKACDSTTVSGFKLPDDVETAFFKDADGWVQLPHLIFAIQSPYTSISVEVMHR